MKYNINVNQKAIIDNGRKIDLIDGAILEYVITFSHSKKVQKFIFDEKIYYWIDYKHLIKEMPLLGITTTDAARRRFDKLVNSELLEKKIINNNMPVFAFGLQFGNYISDEKIESKGSDSKVGGVGLEVGGGSEEKSEGSSSKVGGGPAQKSGNNNTIYTDINNNTKYTEEILTSQTKNNEFILKIKNVEKLGKSYIDLWDSNNGSKTILNQDLKKEMLPIMEIGFDLYNSRLSTFFEIRNFIVKEKLHDRIFQKVREYDLSLFIRSINRFDGDIESVLKSLSKDDFKKKIFSKYKSYKDPKPQIAEVVTEQIKKPNPAAIEKFREAREKFMNSSKM